MSINHYRTLGLANFASAREVQKAFRMLAIQYHPDKHGGSTIFEHKFKEVNAAYQILSDPVQKNQHDNLLRYGAFTTSTVHQTPQANQATQQTWTPPPAQELKHTPFQAVYIKVSLGVVALYLAVLVLSHLISSTEIPEEMIQKINKNYFQQTIQYTKSNQFEKASHYLDSIILIGNSSAHYSDLERNLLTAVENLAVKNFTAKEYVLSLKLYFLLEQLSNKYDFAFNYQNRARIVMCLAFTNQNKELNRKIEELVELPIEDFESAFATTNVLLSNSKYKEAEIVSNRSVPAFMEKTQAIYGAVYSDVLKSGMHNDKLLRPMLQYLCLSKNFFPQKEISIIEDLYRDMLTSEADKDLYHKLRRIDYNIKNLTKDFAWTESDISILKQYDLHRLYQIK